jgi:hypothetical protein
MFPWLKIAIVRKNQREYGFGDITDRTDITNQFDVIFFSCG